MAKNSLTEIEDLQRWKESRDSQRDDEMLLVVSPVLDHSRMILEWLVPPLCNHMKQFVGAFGKTA